MSRRVFVDNLGPSTTREALEELFSGTGKVESVEIPEQPKSSDSSGHAFIVMSSESEASKAIHTLNNTEWHGSRLTVTQASPPAKQRHGFGGGTTVAERKNRS